MAAACACSRSPARGIASLADLRGKAIGVADLTAPDRNFFADPAAAGRASIPTRDVEWRVYPADILPVALQKGEVQAFSLSDPLGWIARERDGLVELANNLSGDFAHRVCCVLGVRGSLVRAGAGDRGGAGAGAAGGAAMGRGEPRRSGRGLRALRQGASRSSSPPWCAATPMPINPLGAELREQIAAYAAELKVVSVIKPSTDPARYAERVTVDVFS